MRFNYIVLFLLLVTCSQARGQYYLLKGDGSVQPYFLSLYSGYADNQFAPREDVQLLYKDYNFPSNESHRMYNLGTPPSFEQYNESYSHRNDFSLGAEFAVVLPVQFIQVKTGITVQSSNRYSFYAYDYFSNRGDGKDTIQFLRLDFNETALHMKPDVAIILTSLPIYQIFVMYMGVGPQLDVSLNSKVSAKGQVRNTYQGPGGNTKTTVTINENHSGTVYKSLNFNFFAGVDFRINRKIGLGTKIQKDALLWTDINRERTAISSTSLHLNMRWYLANKSSNYYRN